MENRSHFHTLEELIRALDKERKLVAALFKDRKKLSFDYNLARELASRKDESLDFLTRFGIVRYNGDFVELEDVYLRFFEDVLQVNEEISVASVKEYIDNLNLAIDYYLAEKNQGRKYGYLKDVRRMLRNIGLTCVRSVIDLKRNIDNTYKNEPTYLIKKKKLVNLDQKRRDIAALITACERLIDEKQATFFMVAMDVQLHSTVSDVRYQLREVYHNLIELDRQIINYLNLIEYQNRLLEKVQKLKYLRDQLLLESNTDVSARLAAANPLWMEPRPKYTLKVSLSMLRNSNEGLQLIKDLVAGKGKGRLRRSNLAPPLSADELTLQQRVMQMVDVSEVHNAFIASGDNLFHFVMNYSGAPVEMDTEARLVLFCQIASQYVNRLNITNERRQYQQFDYPLIYAKQ